MPQSHHKIDITWLGGPEIAALEMTDAEILSAVEQGLHAQGNGQAVIEPRMHLAPDPSVNGHFNVLRGYVAPLGYAGVKIVGDYVDNYKQRVFHPKWPCSICSIPQPACQELSSMRPPSPICAPVP